MHTMQSLLHRQTVRTVEPTTSVCKRQTYALPRWKKSEAKSINWIFLLLHEMPRRVLEPLKIILNWLQQLERDSLAMVAFAGLIDTYSHEILPKGEYILCYINGSEGYWTRPPKRNHLKTLGFLSPNRKKPVRRCFSKRMEKMFCNLYEMTKLIPSSNFHKLGPGWSD